MRLDPMEMLLRLTGDLSAVRTRVTELEDAKLGEALDGLDTKVGQLKETLAAVVEAVRQIQADPEEEEAPDWPGTTPNWMDDLDQEQARVLWDWLTEWSQNKLWPFYAQKVWKPCWYKHPRLRIELTSLCANWYWSYTKGAPPTRVSEWHARWWPHVEKVLREELRNCGIPRDDLKKPKHPVPAPAVPTEATPNPPAPPWTEWDFAEPGFLAAVEKDIARRPAPEKETDGA
ncbi:hypothetical protein ACFY72_35105 [Streptomyces globisporus]|uniref:hypothetical protein n=1 Tax=Streptomyces globisporus TaxID=1908 RepID=UPI00368FE4B3